MQRLSSSDWGKGTDFRTVCRRAGGRRRYNAMRRRQAERRRDAMAKALLRSGLLLCLGRHGLSSGLAGAFGVHRATVWRDLKRLLGGGVEYDFTGLDGELHFRVTCAYRGGPVLSVTDADDNEIRGAARKSILRQFRFRGIR